MYILKYIEYYREKAKASGTEKPDSAFQKAAGNLNRIYYKAEIETTLRTKQSAGYGLLGMVDYPRQVEALMGWIDPFYKEKNFITSEQFIQYGNHTVPLLRFTKFVWADGEIFHAPIEVANYDSQSINKAILHCQIKEEYNLPATDLAQGELITIGSISQKLSSGINGKKLNISVNIAGTNYKNN